MQCAPRISWPPSRPACGAGTTRSGRVTLDAEAARLLGLPARARRADRGRGALPFSSRRLRRDQRRGAISPSPRRRSPRPGCGSSTSAAGCCASSAPAPAPAWSTVTSSWSAPSRRSPSRRRAPPPRTPPSPATGAAPARRSCWTRDAAWPRPAPPPRCCGWRPACPCRGSCPDGLAVFGIEGDRISVIGHHGHHAGDEQPFLDMPLDTDYPAAEVIRTGRAIYLPTPEDYRSRFPGDLAAGRPASTGRPGRSCRWSTPAGRSAPGWRASPGRCPSPPMSARC